MDINFEELTTLSASDLISGRKGSGNNRLGISIVNTKDQGSRIFFTKHLVEELGNPNSVQFAVRDNELYIGHQIPNSDERFRFAENKNVIYNKALIRYLTETFSLDFSNRTSCAFKNAKIVTQEYEDMLYTIAVIKMLPEENADKN